MHKKRQMVVAVLLLTLISQPASPSVVLCQDESRFECLVEHSIELYEQDHERWWRMFNIAAARASTCSSRVEVLQFLRLWLGKTDGEMAEALYFQTEELLKVNPECVVDGFLEMRRSEVETVIAKFCPLSEPEAILQSLRRVQNSQEAIELSSRLSTRIESCN